MTSSDLSNPSLATSPLVTEPGLLARLADDYLRFYPGGHPQTPRPWELQRVCWSALPSKYDLVPSLTRETLRLTITTRKSTTLIWFDPVLGDYHVFIKGDGHEAMANLLPLCGVDGSLWQQWREFLDEGFAEWKEMYVYRRLPGIQYRQVDKNTRAGPSERREAKPQDDRDWGTMPQPEPWS